MTNKITFFSLFVLLCFLAISRPINAAQKPISSPIDVRVDNLEKRVERMEKDETKQLTQHILQYNDFTLKYLLPIFLAGLVYQVFRSAHMETTYNKKKKELDELIQNTQSRLVNIEQDARNIGFGSKRP